MPEVHRLRYMLPTLLSQTWVCPTQIACKFLRFGQLICNLYLTACIEELFLANFACSAASSPARSSPTSPHNAGGFRKKKTIMGLDPDSIPTSSPSKRACTVQPKLSIESQKYLADMYDFPWKHVFQTLYVRLSQSTCSPVWKSTLRAMQLKGKPRDGSKWSGLWIQSGGWLYAESTLSTRMIDCSRKTSRAFASCSANRRTVL